MPAKRSQCRRRCASSIVKRPRLKASMASAQNSARGRAWTPLAVVKTVRGMRSSYLRRFTKAPIPALVAWIHLTRGHSSGSSASFV